MGEKERYKLESYNEAFCQIHDTESDEWYLRKDLVKDLLNQQDAKIKDLETKLAEERKKVVMEIRNKVEQAKLVYEWKGDEVHIEEILDQIERGIND